jgi:ketosteroid isomerase-like protein
MIEQLTDTEAIRHLAAQFTDAINRRDFALFRSLWTSDAVWDIKGMASAEGADAITRLLESMQNNWEIFFQITGEGVIEIEGTRARASFPMIEMGRSLEGKGYTAHAVNADLLLRTQEGWRFQRRTWYGILINNEPLPGQASRLPMDLFA